MSIRDSNQSHAALHARDYASGLRPGQWLFGRLLDAKWILIGPVAPLCKVYCHGNLFFLRIRDGRDCHSLEQKHELQLKERQEIRNFSRDNL